MRNKLRNLIYDIGRDYDDYVDSQHEIGMPVYDDFNEWLTDELIANGVILPPCKVGDTVYYVHETLWDKDYINKVLSKSVKKRILKIVERPNCSTNLALEVLHFDYCFITDWIEGNIFLTKEEAEKVLKEKENE